jgi:hypothetical protein
MTTPDLVTITCAGCGTTGQTHRGSVPADATFAMCPDCEADPERLAAAQARGTRVGEGDVHEQLRSERVEPLDLTDPDGDRLRFVSPNGDPVFPVNVYSHDPEDTESAGGDLLVILGRQHFVDLIGYAVGLFGPGILPLPDDYVGDVTFREHGPNRLIELDWARHGRGTVLTSPELLESIVDELNEHRAEHPGSAGDGARPKPYTDEELARGPLTDQAKQFITGNLTDDLGGTASEGDRG